jgi:cell wall-associated NlpC family hydrolase
MGKIARLIIACAIVALMPSFALAAKTHKVKKNETLYSLAKKYRVTTEELKSANGMAHSRLRPGDVLVIPSRSVAADRGTGRKSASASYKVKRGDTLIRISRKTGVSVGELKRINHLSSTRLKPGRVLALVETEKAEEPARPSAKRYSARIAEVFSDSDFEQSLAELTDVSPAQDVDLSRNVELKADAVKQLKKTAYGFLGTRYRFGANSRNALDCSSFVQQVFREMDISLPRTAREQFVVGEEVPHGDLKKGDLVFFRTYAPYPSHVGIYLGDNKMIHASSRDRRVVISSMDTSYYRARYIGAKRISKINPDTFSLNDLVAGIEEERPDDILSNDTLDVSAN